VCEAGGGRPHLLRVRLELGRGRVLERHRQRRDLRVRSPVRSGSADMPSSQVHGESTQLCPAHASGVPGYPASVRSFPYARVMGCFSIRVDTASNTALGRLGSRLARTHQARPTRARAGCAASRARLVVVRAALQRREHAEVDAVLEVVRRVLLLRLVAPRALGALRSARRALSAPAVRSRPAQPLPKRCGSGLSRRSAPSRCLQRMRCLLLLLYQLPSWPHGRAGAAWAGAHC